MRVPKTDRPADVEERPLIEQGLGEAGVEELLGQRAEGDAEAEREPEQRERRIRRLIVADRRADSTDSRPAAATD